MTWWQKQRVRKIVRLHINPFHWAALADELTILLQKRELQNAFPFIDAN